MFEDSVSNMLVQVSVCYLEVTVNEKYLIDKIYYNFSVFSVCLELV